MLVHIGYKKCGSTWLQRNLFNRTDRGFFPINPEYKKNDTQRAKYLGDYFVFDKDGYLLDPFSNRTPEIQEVFEKSFDRAGNSVPVISSERLAGQAHAGGFDAAVIGQRIADAFPDAMILIIIREQVKMAVSVYFQYLKAGGHRHYRHYFRSPSDKVRPGFAPSFYEYDKLIAYYQALFGAENVLCVPFEQMFMESAIFLEKLRKFAGAHIPNDLPFDIPEKAGLARAVELKTRYLNLIKRPHSLNGYALDTPKFSEDAVILTRNMMSKFVSAAREKKVTRQIYSDVSELLGQRYCESNKKAEELIGVPLGEKFGYM